MKYVVPFSFSFKLLNFIILWVIDVLLACSYGCVMYYVFINYPTYNTITIIFFIHD